MVVNPENCLLKALSEWILTFFITPPRIQSFPGGNFYHLNLYQGLFGVKKETLEISAGFDLF